MSRLQLKGNYGCSSKQEENVLMMFKGIDETLEGLSVLDRNLVQHKKLTVF